MAVTEEVLELLAASKQRVANLTDEQVLDLTRAWVEAWDELAPQFNDAVTNLVNTPDAEIPARTVAKDRRVTQALKQAQERLDGLADATNVTVTTDLSTVMLEAVSTRYESLLLQLPEGQAHALLNRLSTTALDAMVARTTTRIHSLTNPLAEDTVTAMRGELVRGITVGANPRVTASRIVRRTGDQFHGGLTRAATIARTETLDAYRIADHAATQANTSLIQTRIWMATLDYRTCGSCLANHGTEWPVDQFGPEDHPQGRCVFVDKTKSWEELGFSGIEDQSLDLTAQRDAWWDNLTDDTQETILGPGRYELWKNGDIGWADLTTRVDNPDWRPSYIQTPLKDLAP